MSLATPQTIGAAAPESFRLSPQQRRLRRLARDAETGAFETRWTVAIEGEIDRRALTRALARLVRRHEVLRTTVGVIEGVGAPVQTIGAPYRPELTGDEDDGSPVRAELVREGPVEHLLTLRTPGTLTDTASASRLTAELAAAYETEAAGAGDPVAEDDDVLQYADVAQWQDELLESPDAEEEREYWRERDPLPDPAPELPLVSASEGRFAPDALPIELPVEVARGVRSLADELGVPVAAVAASAWWAVAQGSVGDEPVPLGAVFDGRPYDELAEVVGPLARHLPLPGGIAFDTPFRDLVSRVAADLAEVGEWQEYYAWDPLPGDGERSWIGFVAEHRPAATTHRAGSVELSLREVRSHADRFVAKLVTREAGDALETELHHDLGRIDPGTAHRLAGRFTRLLAAAVERPEAPVGALPLLGEDEERADLAVSRSAPAAPEGHLHDRFLETAARVPHRVAVVAEGRALTFGALGRRSATVARGLGRLGIGPGDAVCVFMDRCPERVVAVLGVLRAGAAYVPLDPGLPAARVAHVVADSGARRVLTLDRSCPLLPPLGVPVDALESLDGGEGDGAPDAARPGDLAYVIYTSGSTGRPKGVAIEHRGVASRIGWIQETHPLDGGDAVLQKAPFTFDVSVRETFWPLASGARMVLAEPGGERDTAYLARRIAEERVTVLHFVPSVLALFAEEPEARACASVRRVVCGGEELTPALESLAFDLFDAEIHDSYGPTEASIHATFGTRGRNGSGDDGTIGPPLPVAEVHILGDHLRAVPRGVAGELCIAGIGLARGYVGDPGRTAERFVPHPRSEDPGARLYRSGDRARYRADGSLEWLGRIDDQVKIHGFRVEPGELASVLEAHPAVRRAVAVPREGPAGDLALVAYAVPEADEPAEDVLTAFAAERLPPYMLPARIVHLAALPLGPTGKVDRDALPDPEALDGDRRRDLLAPRGPVEEAIAAMWAGALELDRVGVREDFYALGGNSLLATRLFSRIRRAFRTDVELRELFGLRTVEEVSGLLEEREAAPGRSELIATTLLKIKAGEVSGPAKESPAPETP